MRRAALVLVFAFAGAGHVCAQTITASTALAVEHWVDAVLHHAPGEEDAAVLSIERLTLDDRQTLNVGMPKFLSAFGKTNASSLAEKRIVDLGQDLARNPGISVFLERAAVLHGDAAIFGFHGVVMLPIQSGPAAPVPSGGIAVTPTQIRNQTPSATAKTSPLLFQGHLTIENDGDVVGMMPADWNWVFARSLLDVLARKHVDDDLIGAWYHATTSFMFRTRLFGEAAAHLRRAAELLPDDARILLDRGSYAEMQGLPRSQQILSDEDLLALRMAGQRGQQVTRGLVRPGPATNLDVRPVEVTNAEAEQYFGRALARDPALWEARVRLARLLTGRRRYADALSILHPAPETVGQANPVVSFYAHLFSARAERGLGHLDAAADHARQALSLFPDAQSALMASSQIAMLRADADGAEEPLRHLAALSADSSDRDDPWWVYDIFTGRDAKAILAKMWAQATSAWAFARAGVNTARVGASSRDVNRPLQ